MISLQTALKLKEAGLKWIPGLHDFFAIPDRNLDERLFVISDIQVTVETLGGMKVVSFQGASEWALDYLLAKEAVWMPREDQLRLALETTLLNEPDPVVKLTARMNRYHCSVTWRGQELSFAGEDACEVYAAALLFILKPNE